MISKIIISFVFYFFSSKVFAAEEKGGMPQLNPETFSSQLFWLIIFFVLIFIINHYFFLPKLEKIRLLRKKTIDEHVSDAENINNSIQKIIEKMDSELKIAKDHYNTHIKKIYEENRRIYEKTLKNLNEEIEEKKNIYLRSLSKNEESIRKKFPSICVNLSDTLYKNIMNDKDLSSIEEFKKFDEEK